jgi:hypothetical protein
MFLFFRSAVLKESEKRKEKMFRKKTPAIMGAVNQS